MANLYPCKKNPQDGLCRYGGKKTFGRGLLYDFCYKIMAWLRDVETCPLLDKVEK